MMEDEQQVNDFSKLSIEERSCNHKYCNPAHISGYESVDALFHTLDPQKSYEMTTNETHIEKSAVSSWIRSLSQEKVPSVTVPKKVLKVSVGTQTLRSFLTKQALKQKDRESKQQIQIKTLESKPIETKAIQTSFSYHSSSNSTKSSKGMSEKSRSFDDLVNNNGSGKEPIAWFIPIPKKTQNKNISPICRPLSGNNLRKAKSNEQISRASSPLPLQEAFNRNCFDMRVSSQIRVNRINTIAELRKRTADVRLLEMAKQYISKQESTKVVKTKVIQPVFKSTIKRFFTHEEMRAQTEKIYRNLPEVKAMREKVKQKEREKHQRLLAQIYKYQLKDNALKGRLTWKITQSCLN